MMRATFVSTVLALWLANSAMGQTCSCSGTEQVKGDTTLAAVLAGNTVCVGSSPTFDWQEEHQGAGLTGQLWDFKRGNGHATDPRELVGSWTVSGSGANTIVTHAYSGGSSFSYNVCRVGTTVDYGFCPTSAGATIMAKIKPGINVGCP